jgi:hypothetical protein
MPVVSQQPAVQDDAHDPPPVLEALDVLDVLDPSSPPLLLVLLVVLPPPSSPPLVLDVLLLYMPLEPPGAPDDPLPEPPKLLFMTLPDPPDEPNLPEGVGSPAAQAPTTPLAVTAKTITTTLNPAQSIDYVVYAVPEPKQRGSPVKTERRPALL